MQSFWNEKAWEKRQDARSALPDAKFSSRVFETGCLHRKLNLSGSRKVGRGRVRKIGEIFRTSRQILKKKKKKKKELPKDLDEADFVIMAAQAIWPWYQRIRNAPFRLARGSSGTLAPREKN